VGGIIKRGDIYHLRMRVPVRYAEIEPKGFLFRSLKTGDQREAKARAAVVERQIIAELDAKLLGQETPGSRSHFEAIAALTAARGFSYKTAEELAQGDTANILRRIESLLNDGQEPGSPAAQAVLGSVEYPKRTLGKLAEEMASLNPYEIDCLTSALVEQI
jgi:hypothetical protein